MTTRPLIKNDPFIAQGSLSDNWYFVYSWRPDGHGNKIAHEKFDITDQINNIIKNARE